MAPLLALFLKFEMTIVREILEREEFKPRNGQSQVLATLIGHTKGDLLQPCIRLLDLLEIPAEITNGSVWCTQEIVSI